MIGQDHEMHKRRSGRYMEVDEREASCQHFLETRRALCHVLQASPTTQQLEHKTRDKEVLVRHPLYLPGRRCASYAI